MNIKIILIHVFLLFGLVSCDSSPVTTDYSIPKDEFEHIIDEANKGDLEAIKRLIAHYDDSIPGYKAMHEKWTSKARGLGDPEELYNFSAILLTKAYRENDTKKKSDLLSSALKNAQLAHLNNKNHKTKKNEENIKGLIAKINKEIELTR